MKYINLLHILIKDYTNCGYMDVPLVLWSMGLILMFGVTASIRFYGRIYLIDYLVICKAYHTSYMSFGYLHFIGKVAKRSEDILSAVKSDERRKFWRKKLKSMKILGLRNGPISILRYNAIHYFYSVLINGIVTILSVVHHS